MGLTRLTWKPGKVNYTLPSDPQIKSCFHDSHIVLVVPNWFSIHETSLRRTRSISVLIRTPLPIVQSHPPASISLTNHCHLNQVNPTCCVNSEEGFNTSRDYRDAVTIYCWAACPRIPLWPCTKRFLLNYHFQLVHACVLARHLADLQFTMIRVHLAITLRSSFDRRVN